MNTRYFDAYTNEYVEDHLPNELIESPWVIEWDEDALPLDDDDPEGYGGIVDLEKWVMDL